jgi:hypothetical protein
VWIAPGPETEPKPPSGYVVSLACLHEQGFGVPAGRFIHTLCHHYEVELHNFAPNAISQAAVFVAICDGYLGNPAHWDLWRHLFRGGLYTDSVSQGVRRPVHAGGLTLHLWESRKDLYIPNTMTANNRD